ncbi:hypothetical protein CW751_11230 [Brumimicrobium salinarum]|uniref:Coenzyme Q-binding protein COQ10 START domain-containing protein n=1 Tax=Brumimicrobium salinarum TaxID=2058658 RepID=A0A2I0R0W6_9FLAO|nr:SRPBCC family protein [Brumimicrobium salinarum]PKR80226.1 hypothetical protein CW751_11230 [Brumimicrobium salinarum]
MYQIRYKQFVPTDIDTCWDFFSSPKNLKEITPDYMGFIVKNQIPEKMYEGLMIEYTVTPIMKIPMNWITEITHVTDKRYFVDEQRKGPYKIWHHEHHFKAVEGGVEMEDILTYELPLGFLGKIAHTMFVKSKVQEIFEYRNKKVEEIFK